MAFTLVRADAIYTVPFASPALELLGDIPDHIRLLYQTFVDRYPGIPVNAFRALSSNNVSEVGLQVSLLDGRLEIAMRVDQMSVQATNIRNSGETSLGQDCALLMHAFMEKVTRVSEGLVSLRIASWLNVDVDKDGVAEILARVATPQRAPFDPALIGAERMEHVLKMTFHNPTARWQFLFAAEPAALADPNANLYLMRDYQFIPGGELDTTEKRLGFVEMSSNALCEWLGIGTLVE
jgi:hypothetical protein